ncbi:hypothetical protein [uncultured Sunxiuqinia sp.]|uniref:hypothetical protein n=1 Tax=uncultured Sunxiuqinia sp. TaxID=1573825 RepID=UPI002AA81485|nr:hypothetical protein [uncultured Sunxiuqinia sp.]
MFFLRQVSGYKTVWENNDLVDPNIERIIAINKLDATSGRFAEEQHYDNQNHLISGLEKYPKTYSRVFMSGRLEL